MKLSVVIANYNGRQYLVDCLASVLREKGDWFEVIVVDDGSSDDSAAIVERAMKQDKRLRLLRLKKNQGPAKARNKGVRQSQGRYLLFLDVDTRVGKGALKKIADKLDKEVELGAVQAKLDTSGHFLSWWGLPYEVKGKERIIFGGRTAGLAVRREVFVKIGGFDEDYFIYGEDTDLCWRIWLVGFRVELLAEAVIDHQGRSSLNQQTKVRIFYQGAKNHLSNILKNADGWMLVRMLPLNVLAWSVIGVRLMLTGQLSLAGAVVRGLGWNLSHFGRTMAKRRQIMKLKAKNNQCRQVMFGKIGLKQLIKKGWRWANAV